ncbi:hypothetical protein ACOSQ2_028746 [Xanthoceras sorbifolium]
MSFPWNGQRHTLISEEELMIALKKLDGHSKDEIEFEISLEPVGVKYPEEPIGLLTFNNEALPVSLNNGAPPATIKESDSNEDDSYKVDEETGGDSEVSLDEELCEEGHIFSVSIPMVMTHFFKAHQTMIMS